MGQVAMDDTGGLVYVVDDDVSVRETLAGLVASAGLTAETTASSQEFLDILIRAMTRGALI